VVALDLGVENSSPNVPNVLAGPRTAFQLACGLRDFDATLDQRLSGIPPFQQVVRADAALRFQLWKAKRDRRVARAAAPENEILSIILDARASAQSDRNPPPKLSRTRRRDCQMSTLIAGLIGLVTSTDVLAQCGSIEWS